MRSTITAASIAVVLTLSLAACGDDTDSSATTAAGTTPATTAAPADTTAETEVEDTGAAAAFPVTIEHAFGSTTIDEEPLRVVSIGFSDHDALLAFGVEPVAIRQWYGDYEYVWPWAEDALGDLEPALIPSSDLNFEQIAALDPDLIIGQYIGLEETDYDTLARSLRPSPSRPTTRRSALRGSS